MISEEIIEAKRRELIEQLTIWAEENDIIPRGYKLLVNVDLRVVTVPRVEAQINQVKEEFTRRAATYLTRELTGEEIEQLRNLSFNDHDRCILDFILDRGNFGTMAEDINEMLGQKGYAGYKSDVYRCFDGLNSVFYNAGNQFRFTFLEGDDSRSGRYRIFRKA